MTVHVLSGESRFAVFRASNRRLKEMYFVANDQSIFEAMAQMRLELPPGLEHWAGDEPGIEFESLAFGLRFDEACEFIEEELDQAPPEGWCLVAGLLKGECGHSGDFRLALRGSARARPPTESAASLPGRIPPQSCYTTREMRSRRSRLRGRVRGARPLAPAA